MILRGALSTFARRARPASSTAPWLNPPQGTLLPQQPPRLLSSKPTPQSVAHFVNEFCEMNNEQLFILASDGDPGARKERLIREVMAVDEIEWDEAEDKVENVINVTNNQGLFFVTLPQRLFILAAVGTGLATFPLCFDLNTALVFNDYFVTADVAEPQDLETMLEVGTWTWNWMEPPLGQACFFILCLDFARAQLDNLGRKPYVENLIENRAERLSRSFPQYHKRIVEEFATSRGLKST